MEKSRRTVCVTGGAGYLGSWLVLKLLQNGHVVHATLRNLGDESKIRLLKSLEGADERLILFEADIYDADKFEPAIQGCEFVFLVATPLQHYDSSSQYKDTTEASLASVRSILTACQRSGTVKRIIYTASVFSASPLKEDGSGFKNSMDESCWTPLHLPLPYVAERDYVLSKTITEKELLSNNSAELGEWREQMEVVSLTTGVVEGDTILPVMPASMAIIVSPVTGETVPFKQLKLMQTILGSVPLVHVEDVCEAHVFCMEKTSLSGRLFCATGYPTFEEIWSYFECKYHCSTVNKELEGGQTAVPCSSTKLIDLGFRYKFNVEQIIDGSVQCAKKFGKLSTNFVSV